MSLSQKLTLSEYTIYTIWFWRRSRTYWSRKSSSSVRVTITTNILNVSKLIENQ